MSINNWKDAKENKHGQNPVAQKSFWDPGYYSVALKRFEASDKVLSDLNSMLEDMANIETRTGKEYVELSEKWNRHFEGFENVESCNTLLYGSTKETVSATIALLGEKGKSHMENWSSIQSKCLMPIKHFNDTYNTKSCSIAKRTKALKEDFETAQQPYVEVFSSFKKARQNYVTYCMSLRPGCEVNAFTDTFSDIDNKKNDKRLRLFKRFEGWREQLDITLPHYVLRMKEVFEKCEKPENDKLNTIKKVIHGLHEILELKNNSRHNQLIQRMLELINEIDIDADLKFWYDTFGPGVPYDFFKVEDSIKRLYVYRQSTVTSEETENAVEVKNGVMESSDQKYNSTPE